MNLDTIRSHARRLWSRNSATDGKPSLRFDRPLLLFQSDDWGRVGVRDREGWQELEAAGVPLTELPYDFYSLETAEDLEALSGVLRKHRDCGGRCPSIGMNFIMANVDFDRYLGSAGNEIPLLPLTRGFPGTWQRPRLFDTYQQGIEEGLFFTALHGLTHFCQRAVQRELAAGAERSELILKMWHAQTPYIYRRMQWVGYEYWDPQLAPEQRFLTLDDQRAEIGKAAEIYRDLFGSVPFSACAPGYRANNDTHTAWFEVGIRVAQNGPDEGKAPYLDHRGMLQTFRTLEMEPAIGQYSLAGLVESVDRCFRAGLPAIVSIHSINFHSTLRDFRTPTLSVLNQFLTAVEKKWPNLLYINDADLFRIASEGFYQTSGCRIDVSTVDLGASN